MIQPTTYAGKRLLTKLKYDVDYERLEAYAEMIRMIEVEAVERSAHDAKDEAAEKMFLQPINPDPVTNIVKKDET